MLLVVFYAFVFAITVNESLGCLDPHFDICYFVSCRRSLSLRKVNISMRNQYLVESIILFPCLKQFDFKRYFSFYRRMILQLDIGHLEFVQKTENLV